MNIPKGPQSSESVLVNLVTAVSQIPKKYVLPGEIQYTLNTQSMNNIICHFPNSDHFVNLPAVSINLWFIQLFHTKTVSKICLEKPGC